MLVQVLVEVPSTEPVTVVVVQTVPVIDAGLTVVVVEVSDVVIVEELVTDEVVLLLEVESTTVVLTYTNRPTMISSLQLSAPAVCPNGTILSVPATVKP
jgi:hypothetical protein